MTSRKAACDPCRKIKLGCDHKRPICTRCEQSGKGLLCAYRASPFKRKRTQPHSNSLNDMSQRNSDSIIVLPVTGAPYRSTYSNTRHFGSSSHVAIFNQIQTPNTGQNSRNAVVNHSHLTSHDPPSGWDEAHRTSNQVVDLLDQLFSRYCLEDLQSLVRFWLARGINLALAGLLVEPCTEAMSYLSSNLLTEGRKLSPMMTASLLQNSQCSLQLSETSSFSDFTSQFCGSNIRWETLGIFFSAVIRASIDTSYCPQLYMVDTEKYELRRLLIRLNKATLDLCVSLDCLNDLQLIFQYENFIVNSYVDGDHNLSSWRSLSDAIASLFALGYHENIAGKPNTPNFLVNLRQTAFARLYSADKNLAIFLGRPPRMSKRFCYFQVPPVQIGNKEGLSQADGWHPQSTMSYASETRWSAICASLKEEIIELLVGTGEKNQIAEKVIELSDRVEVEWQTLPQHFQLQGSLIQHSPHTPFERDFLASTRLNYLHVHLLLRLVLTRLTEPDSMIVEISRKILSLIVEIILLRDRLANSGTGLTWKIAHYGLPAAGILLLAFLKRSTLPDMTSSAWNRAWQDLNVLAAEVQAGSIIAPGEPNYALLSEASRTISSFLDSITIDGDTNRPEKGSQQPDTVAIDDWLNQWNADPWNLEIEFWQSLGGYPFTASGEFALTDSSMNNIDASV